jgi:hypothetical protein
MLDAQPAAAKAKQWLSKLQAAQQRHTEAAMRGAALDAERDA